MSENPNDEQTHTEPEEPIKSSAKPPYHTFDTNYYGGMILMLVVLVLIVSMLGYALFLTGNPSPERVLLLATTTSTANTGLLDEILPDFEKKYNASTKVIPVGTGQALEMGRRGDVDVLMVHAPSREQAFIDDGYGTARYQVCYNYFVILGPPGDPAGIRNVENSSEAMRMIFETHSRFVSRGDDSGTHTKEKSLWAAAGFDYISDIDISGNEWYYSVNTGMGTTLMRANELEAYTLSDEATFWAYEGNLDLTVVQREDSNLLNQYSVIPINPDRFSHVNYELAMDLVDWLTSQEVQDTIARFERNGHILFVPNAEELP